MRGQPGFFDVDERLKELSSKGDALERLSAIVDFELFGPDLARAVPRWDRAKGGRPPFDLVFMVKVLILQASHSLSDERTEFLIKDRLSFMRFLGLGLSDPVPDATTIWTFREALTRAQIEGKPAIEVLFAADETALREAGFLAMGGQIVDATVVAAPKPRNTWAEKAALKAGRVPDAWKVKPAKLAQKDRDARWTTKWSKAKPAEDGSKRIDIAVPAFGDKNHVGIDRRHGLIRTGIATDAARHDGAQRPGLLSKANTAGDVWADTAYRSKQNEAHLLGNGFVSRIHRKKPPGKLMPVNIARANGRKSKIRAAVEPVFAREMRSDGARRAHHRVGESHGQDRAGSSRLQHEPGGLARPRPGKDSLRIKTEKIRPASSRQSGSLQISRRPRPSSQPYRSRYQTDI